MGKIRISLAATAFTDLENIELYIADDSPTLARLFINKIFLKIEQLNQYPESGKIVQELNNELIRELVFKKYRIVYQILSRTEVVVLRIIHGSKLLDVH